GQRVTERQLVARVLPDVDEGHVPAAERGEQDDRRDERDGGGGGKRVLRRQREAPPPLPRGVRTGGQRVRDEAEGQEERRAPEQGHQVLELLFAGAYFDGHFVTSEPGFATKVPLRSVPSTTTCRPVLNRSGTLPWYTTGSRVAVALPMSLSVKRRPPRSYELPRVAPTTAPTSVTSPVWPATELGVSCATPFPASAV